MLNIITGVKLSSTLPFNDEGNFIKGTFERFLCLFFYYYFHAISLANICLDAANAIESNLTNLEEENCRVIFP